MPTDRPERNSNRRTNTPIDNTYGHLQPQAPDIERVVLGALMIDKDAYSVVADILTPETFYDPRHQIIFEAIGKLYQNDHPVDIITVAEEVRTMGKLDTVGGATYIVELSSNVASSAHIEYHASILKKKFLSRQLISYASMIETKAFDDTEDADELVQDAEAELFKISQRNMKQDYTQVGPVVAIAMQILQKASENTSGLTGIPSGYPELDNYTSGWQKSDLVIIAGRPAMGKTSFALSLAKNIGVDYNVPIAFFSLEMDNVQLINRLLSNVCEISGKKMLNGQLSQDEWGRLDKNVSRLKNAPIYVDDTPGMGIFELQTKARRLVREKGVKIIMVDYLQLMHAHGAKFGSRQEEVSTISRSLKGLAKELGVPILALSQLNRMVDNRDGVDGKRPQLSDLRESGAIEQDADMVLFVHRPEYYRIFDDGKGNDTRGKAQIIIAKHRKGSIGDVLLAFKGEFTRFQNIEDEGAAPKPDNMPFGGEYIDSKINGDMAAPYPFGEIQDNPDY